MFTGRLKLSVPFSPSPPLHQSMLALALTIMPLLKPSGMVSPLLPTWAAAAASHQSGAHQISCALTLHHTFYVGSGD